MKMLDVVVEKTTFLIVAVFVRDATKIMPICDRHGRVSNVKCQKNN